MAELTRVTINLSAPTVAALDRLAEATGANRTDVTNRAIRLMGALYDMFPSGQIAVQNGDVTERLWFL